MKRPRLNASSEKRRRYELGMGLNKSRWKLPQLQQLLVGIACFMTICLFVFTTTSTSEDSSSTSSSSSLSAVEPEGSIYEGGTSKGAPASVDIPASAAGASAGGRSFRDALDRPVGHVRNHISHHHNEDAHDKHIDEDFKGNIYMDWMLPSDYFDFINYKSLESLLQAYPNAKCK